MQDGLSILLDLLPSKPVLPDQVHDMCHIRDGSNDLLPTRDTILAMSQRRLSKHASGDSLELLQSYAKAVPLVIDTMPIILKTLPIAPMFGSCKDFYWSLGIDVDLFTKTLEDLKTSPEDVKVHLRNAHDPAHASYTVIHGPTNILVGFLVGTLLKGSTVDNRPCKLFDMSLIVCTKNNEECRDALLNCSFRILFDQPEGCAEYWVFGYVNTKWKDRMEPTNLSKGLLWQRFLHGSQVKWKPDKTFGCLFRYRD
jgi:hypothetical protein